VSRAVWRWTYGEWEGRQTCTASQWVAKNKQPLDRSTFAWTMRSLTITLVRYFENPRIECVTDENENKHLIR